MDALLVMLGNTKTTVIGVLAAAAIYVSQIGGKMPSTSQEWWAFAFGVLAIALGVAAKDATTGSRPQ